MNQENSRSEKSSTFFGGSNFLTLEHYYMSTLDRNNFAMYFL